MVKRQAWIARVEAAWAERPIVWLAGVRRVGKTCLAQTLPDVEYFDCELPRVRRQMEDPEGFWAGLGRRRVVLDEVHRLPNPSELLKIAADHFPRLRVLATGSSTLGASTRFRDTLTGRKRDLRLLPMTLQDLEAFGNRDLRHRFLHGGLPPFFLASSAPERDFQEWMDAFSGLGPGLRYCVSQSRAHVVSLLRPHDPHGPVAAGEPNYGDPASLVSRRALQQAARRLERKTGVREPVVKMR